MIRLRDMLQERSVRFGEFTLASGKTSNFFIDCKPVVLSAEGHRLVGDAFCHAIERECDAVPQHVAGVALGGCSLASAVACRSVERARPIDALYVRKEAKGHGTKKRVEGHFEKGDTVVVVEDTVTTGGSTVRAISELNQVGLTVTAVFAIVDRLEGAAEAIGEHVPFFSLFTRDDFQVPS